MLAQSLPTKSRKRLAHDLFATFATHAGLVHDITDTDCWAQNGSTHGHVFITLNFIFNLFFYEQDQKSNEKLHCLFSFFFFFSCFVIIPFLSIWPKLYRNLVKKCTVILLFFFFLSCFVIIPFLSIWPKLLLHLRHTHTHTHTHKYFKV